MKAVILAAGKGTRLAPLTNEIPKVMVLVAGKPYLQHVIERLLEAGFDELCLIVGYKKEKIVSFVEEKGYNVTFVEQKEQKGTGHAIGLAKEFVGEANFLVYYADNLISVSDLKNISIKDEFHYTIAAKVEDPTKYGMLVIEDNFLKKVVEKPLQFSGNLANAGLYKFTPEIFSLLDKLELSSRGELEVTDAVNVLAKQGRVKVYKLHDYWLDLGCKEDIEKIEKFFEDN